MSSGRSQKNTKKIKAGVSGTLAIAVDFWHIYWMVGSNMNAKAWVLEAVCSPTIFLTAAARHLPTAHTASFEIRAACPQARRVYARHRSPKKYRPLRDTFSPRTHLYYCLISETLSDQLNGVLREHKPAKVFWHIKGFDDQHMLFSFHDADSGGSVCLSPQVAPKAVRAIAAALKCKPRKIEARPVWGEEYGS